MFNIEESRTRNLIHYFPAVKIFKLCLGKFKFKLKLEIMNLLALSFSISTHTLINMGGVITPE